MSVCGLYPVSPLPRYLQKPEESKTPQQQKQKDQDEPEELDFLFDEEMEQMDGRKNTFTDWSDEDSDYEIDDRDVNKILIVTQTPPYLRRHPGGDRTGNHTSRAKMISELAKVINDGLYYYEQDLWTEQFEPEYSQIKVTVADPRMGGIRVGCGEPRCSSGCWAGVKRAVQRVAGYSWGRAKLGLVLLQCVWDSCFPASCSAIAAINTAL